MTTTLHITVGDREQLREDALQFVQAGDAGDLAKLFSVTDGDVECRGHGWCRSVGGQ